MAKKKKDKSTYNNLQNIPIELQIEYHEPHYKPGWTQVLWKGRQFLLPS